MHPRRRRTSHKDLASKPACVPFVPGVQLVIARGVVLRVEDEAVLWEGIVLRPVPENDAIVVDYRENPHIVIRENVIANHQDSPGTGIDDRRGRELPDLHHIQKSESATPSLCSIT